MEDLSTITLHALKYTALMKMKFKVYTYITPDHEPGTIIVHPDLTAPFDEQKLFEMDNLVVSELSLRDILEKGFIKLGSTDTMDKMDIEYPLIRNDTFKTNKITGRHWDYSQQEVADMIGKDFEVEVIEQPVFNSDSLDTASESSDVDDVIIEHNQNEGADETEKNEDELGEPEQADSVLQDGKMDDIMGQITECQETSVKDVDRLLSELEF